jgi:RimJ/RimL family protein N-acetyltransferase
MPSTISFTPKPTLTGKRVVLRPLTVADVPAILATGMDPEVRRLTGTHRRFTTQQVHDAVTDWIDRDDRVDMAVIEKDSGEYAGEITLNELDADNLSCHLRVALSSRYTGLGLGTEAIRLMLSYAFDSMGVHRVELDVYAFNPRARRVYEKIGFVYEGTKRQALRWRGEWVDAMVMAMLVDDWAVQRVSAATNGRLTGLR